MDAGWSMTLCTMDDLRNYGTVQTYDRWMTNCAGGMTGRTDGIVVFPQENNVFKLQDEKQNINSYIIIRQPVTCWRLSHFYRLGLGTPKFSIRLRRTRGPHYDDTKYVSKLPRLVRITCFQDHL